MFQDVLNPGCVKIGTEAGNKDELLKIAASLAAGSGRSGRYGQEDIYNALKAREELGSTGFEEGVAIPHCALPDLEEFIVGLICIPQGIDFEAVDGSKSRFVFIIIGPADQRNRHIRILSAISKLMKNDRAKEQLQNCIDEGRLYQSLLGYLQKESGGSVVREKCQFTIFVQQEDLFEEILESVTTHVEGSVMVLDSRNAGQYLNRLPLFSAFWNDSPGGFNRIIIAVLDKVMMNDVVRKINTLADLENSSGVYITVQDLLYASGSLDF